MRHLVVLVMLAGCGDDLSLQISVQHPQNAQIDRTVVTIYEPADATDCTAIEFQDVSETTLAGMEVASFDSTDASASLDGISRTGTKLVVARGFREGMYFTAGCTEKGTIGGNDEVLVETQVVAAVSLGGVEADGMDIASIPITITTPLGSALPRRPISWRVDSFAGAKPMSSPVALENDVPDQWEPTQTTCTGPDGTIRLRPIPPSEIGGYAARVRVSWGETAPRTFSSFTRVEPVRKDLGFLQSTGSSGRLCTTRTSGATKRVVCIEDQDPSAAVDPIARDLAVTVAAGQASLATVGSQSFLAGEVIVAVYSIGSGATRDAYAITAGGRVIGLFSPSRPPSGTQVPFTAGEGLVEEVMVMPACKAGDQPRLVVRTRAAASQKLWIMDPLGGPHTTFGNGLDTPNTIALRLNTAGCATELQTDNPVPTSRQVVVVDSGLAAINGTVAFYDCSAPAGKCITRLPSLFSGVGFKRGKAIDEDRLVTSSFDTTGTVLSELIFLDSKIVERTRISSASIPDRIVSGKFDADDDVDLVWNFAAIVGTQTNFQVSYGRTIDGQPLTALTGAKALVVDDMFTAEVTGDAFDDVVIVQRSRDGSAPTGVSVIPVGAAAAPLNVRTDDTCQ